MPRPRLLSMKVNPTNASDDFDEQSSMESVIPHRPRGQTISIPSPHHTFNKLKKAQEQASAQKPKEEEVKGGIDPSFVFLQLYGGLLSLTPPDIPLLLPHNQVRIFLEMFISLGYLCLLYFYSKSCLIVNCL